MITRRAALVSALALAACGRARASDNALPALNTLVPFPLGVAAMTGEFDDPDWTALAVTNFGRVTPEWEMKMESLVAPGGDFDWTRADRLATLARSHGLKIHGHTLIWYAQAPDAFTRIANDRARLAAAYRTYILGVAGRYRGRVQGWDVVNEPIADDGSLRDCLWRKSLGDDYVRLAFQHAREAEPDAPLFLNDYDLESKPAKRAGFMKLAESLLKAGAPLTGLGTQTHVNADLEPGSIRACVADLASLGLKIHVSEFDVSLNRAGGFDHASLEKKQAALAAEVSDAMASLPEAQRYGVTIWAARDKDSWLRRGSENKGLTPDAPVLFDDAGRAKPMARAFVKV
ncbi:MAG TPA: endo-1,4-beta-xylanase [Caulobacteraceae bacterium]|jgi:endo-1,4-beta-xylanase|nr:endo-1,4-beta-xylanase [Caulobacteraceae bacterium]